MSSLAISIGCGIAIIVVIVAVLWYWRRKLLRDYDVYVEKRESTIAEASTTIVNGNDGAHGLDAFQQWKNLQIQGTGPPTSAIGVEGDYYIDTTDVDPNNHDVWGPKGATDWPTIPIVDPETYFDNLFIGTSGMGGIDAPDALDGAPGDDGSEGNIGDAGIDGLQGPDGIAGETGVEGDSFVTFNADTPAASLPMGLDFSMFPGTIDLIAPMGFPTSAVFKANTGEIKTAYYYKGNLLCVIDSTWTEVTTNQQNGYVSYIIYTENYDIIGITDAICLPNFNEISTPATQTLSTNVSQASMNLKFRVILSLNKGLVMSSFTSNIIEETLKDKEFIFTKATETDPFIASFYDVIQATPALEKSQVEFLEMSKISQSQDITAPSGTLSVISLP